MTSQTTLCCVLTSIESVDPFLSKTAMWLREVCIPVKRAVEILCQGAEPDWENPSCFAINRLPAHCALSSWRSEVAARRDLTSPSVRLLDGFWQFSFFEKPADVTEK